MNRRHHTVKEKINCNFTVGFLIFFLFSISFSCGCQETKGNEEEAEEYHADNDIAMTIRSIVDAIKVGEPLDSTFYDFNGILTDGLGSPLYTDMQGSPGVWEIDIPNDHSAVIRNTYIGDLLPDDLRQYVLQSLEIEDNDPIEYISSSSYENDQDDMTLTYDFGDGLIRFETQTATSPKGMKGKLIKINLFVKTTEEC